MEKIITYEKLANFAYSNDKLIKGTIRGVMVEFFGLGCTSMNTEYWNGTHYAESGILFVQPYNNPWSWMNRQAVAYTDEILDVLFEKYGLSDSTPVVALGNSMGGLASIVYTKYAKRTPVLCAANCPVCDLVYHVTERPDLPRTIYSAFANYDMTFEDAMKTASPIHLAKTMPRIPYRIFHCDGDTQVNVQKHSVRFEKVMKEAGQDIVLRICHSKDHCCLTEEYNREYWDTCQGAIDAYYGK